MRSLGMLAARLLRGEAVVAGVLSGTSADGIDVVLARFGAALPDVDLGTPELLAFEILEFDPLLEKRIRALLDGRPSTLAEIALLHAELGRAFGRAARAVAQDHGLPLDLVASHGQTVYHHDGVEALEKSSLQLGDGDAVAEAAGAAVVSDFRARDIAAGGEGAPISALADGVLYAGVPRPTAILNLGGMANVSFLPESGEPLSFDTGPAGSLLDGLARVLLGRAMDEGGRVAARGRVDRAFVALLLRHRFFDRTPPRSTGRDTFGAAWVAEVIARAEERGLLVRGPEDLFASAVEFIAQTVAQALERFLPARPASWIVAGGGSHNAALGSALARATGLTPATSPVPPDTREALVFAVLGARAILGIPSTSPAATGARRGRVLGKLSFPSIEG